MDFFGLWTTRLIADVYVNTGKSLREEPDTYSFTERVRDQAGITKEDYEATMKGKRVAVLTRKLSNQLIHENEFYTMDLFEKIIYPTECDLTDEDYANIQ